MTIIVFLVDTSGSMNQRTYSGMSLLDTAKGAVETFMKIRSRDHASRMDRYMLLTFEDPPANVKAGWKESHSTFAAELKRLEGHGLTTLGPALKHTFDLLNINRMQSGIDTYGQGRCPFYLEPAVIVCITDGKKLTTQSAVQAELNLPMMNAVPGSELTKEPFRWDQRLFGIVLKVPAVPPPDFHATFIPAAEDSPIDCMCDVTGGRSYAVSSQRMLHQCLESIVQKVQSGVVINFEKIGPDPTSTEENSLEAKNGAKENTDINRLDAVVEEEKNKRVLTPTPQSNLAWQTCRKLIYVPRSAQKGYSVGHWPIPESFWPDLNSPMLPPRSAHPVIKFSCTSYEALVVENFPFDKYELEASPLTQFILERRQPNTVWQVFVANSAKYSDIGHPFGYLKASSNLSVVNLFVMPYNYPVLLPLLDDLFKVHKMKPGPKWRQQFDNYLKTMPVYYAQPLRRALARVGVQNLVPDQLDNCLSYSVVSYLKKLKNQAKVEYERLVNSVGLRTPQSEGIKVVSKNEISLLQRKDFKEVMAHYGSNMAMLKQELVEFPTFVIGVPDKDLKPQPYKNAFDVQRQHLIDQTTRMRANFFQSHVSGPRLQDQEALHSVAIGTMGNYQDYLKRMPSPLREIENTPVRQHMFGNPFKVNKNLMLIDEADEAMPGQEKPRRKHTLSQSSMSSMDSPPPSPGMRKRKAGPLPRGLPYRKLLTPPPEEKEETPPPSPASPRLVTTPPVKKHKPLPLPEVDSSDLMDEVFELPMEDEANHIGDSSDELELDFVTNHNDAPDKVEDLVLENNVKEESVIESAVTLINSKKNKARLKVEKDHNTKMWQLVLKEVKKPGKNFDQLMEKLGELQGSVEVRTKFVQEVMHEASRFKRRALVALLEQFLKKIRKNDSKGPKGNKAKSNHIRAKKSPSR